MADISKYLEDILSAIYGEEVRHSIHDAIAAIDNEVYTGVEDAKAEVAKAAAQAANAAASAQSAATSASTASQAATRAGASVTSAANEADRAKTEADKAAGSASSASSSASKAAASATLSQSWATGDTNSRAGEESNNSKYYAEQAKRALSAISGSLVPMGTITFEQLPSAPLQPGVMYNISNEFTTDGRFNEGAGHKYGAGTNVYWTGESKWDCLAAPGGISDITADNFSGILPVEKGGTNNSLATYIKEKLSLEAFRSQIKQPQKTAFIAPARHEVSDDPNWPVFASGIKFGVADTNGYIVPNWQTPRVDVGGGNYDRILWHKQLAFSDQIPTIATTSKAGLVKPGAGLQVSDDGTLSATEFSGVLPVEKGGTGNSLDSIIGAAIDTFNFKSQINQQKLSNFIMPLRFRSGNDNWPSEASGVAFGVADTEGYLAVSFNNLDIRAIIGGGSGGRIDWTRRIMFDGDAAKTIADASNPDSPNVSVWYNQYLPYTSGDTMYMVGADDKYNIGVIRTEAMRAACSDFVATSSELGLVKPGAGLQVSDDGTLSVTGISGDYHVHIVHGVKWDTGHQLLLTVGVDPVTGDVAEFPITALATVTSKYIANGTQSGTSTLYGLLNISISYSFGFTVNFQIQTTDNDHSISTAAEVFNLFKRIYPENFQVPATGYWLQSN